MWQKKVKPYNNHMTEKNEVGRLGGHDKSTVISH